MSRGTVPARAADPPGGAPHRPVAQGAARRRPPRRELRPVVWLGDRLRVLDQTALPLEERWLDLFDADEDRNGELREYFAALNAARLWLARLEARLAALGLDRAADDPFRRLDAHLSGKNGGER